MSIKQLLNIFVVTLLLIGIWGAGGLFLDEIQTGSGCPKIWKIPACLIILICFLAAFLTHILNKWNTIYFVFTGIALTIAIVSFEVKQQKSAFQNERRFRYPKSMYLMQALRSSAKLYLRRNPQLHY